MKNEKQQHFLAHYEPVHASFERFCRARAYGQTDYQDLLNDSLVVAYTRWDEMRQPSSMLSFLCGIAIRLLANQHKKKKEEFPANEQLLLQAPAATSTDHNAEVYFLHQGLAQLPDDQREALILFEINGFSTKEVAAIQGVSDAAVRQRLSRGRQQLTRILTQVSPLKTGKELQS